MKDAMKKIGLLAGAAAFALALSVPGARQAEAAQIVCPLNIHPGLVQYATGCEYSDSENQDNTTDPLVVNTEEFFKLDTWVFWNKDEGATGQGLSGNYDFGAGLPAAAETLMIVFKDGQGTFLVGYTVSQTSGTWESPFRNPPFTALGSTQIKEVSHISYYYSLDDVTTPEAAIPEPMTLALFGLGLAGLGVASRRRRAA